MSQKLEFVLKTFKMEKSFTELCTEYGISTKTSSKPNTPPRRSHMRVDKN